MGREIDLVFCAPTETEMEAWIRDLDAASDGVVCSTNFTFVILTRDDFILADFAPAIKEF